MKRFQDRGMMRENEIERGEVKTEGEKEGERERERERERNSAGKGQFHQTDNSTLCPIILPKNKKRRKTGKKRKSTTHVSCISASTNKLLCSLVVLVTLTSCHHVCSNVADLTI